MNWIPDFILKIFGHKIADKLHLEDKMDGTKPWYTSKNLWTGVITSLLGLYASLGGQFHLPVIPDWIYTLLGTIGVYTRVVATDKLTS